jgi:hypothetical protein
MPDLRPRGWRQYRPELLDACSTSLRSGEHGTRPETLAKFEEAAKAAPKPAEKKEA